MQKKLRLEKAQKWLNSLRQNPYDYKFIIRRLHQAINEGDLSFKDIGTSEEELEQLRIKGYKLQAQKWLEQLRQGDDGYELTLKFLHEARSEGRFSLIDIGTSEEELEQLRIKGYKLQAQKWLEQLRQGDDGYELTLKFLRKALSHGFPSLKDIGTSEEEINQLRIKNCKLTAQKWLNLLRQGDDSYELTLEFLRKAKSEGYFSLKDIGTSEEELEQLRIKGCKTKAQEWLENLRQGYSDPRTAINILREAAGKGSLSLKDICTSEAELALYL